jgi:hypothetical protein
MHLTSENVNNIFTDCLYNGGSDIGENEIMGNGVMQDFIFNRQKINRHTEDIAKMIDQLPDNFKKSVGGGWSFLNMALDKDGNQWCDLHQTMERLLSLGIAINKMGFAAPRYMWKVLPGGMPYVYVND